MARKSKVSAGPINEDAVAPPPEVAAKGMSQETIDIELLQRASVRLRLIGETPLYMNRMSEKARQQLLVGGRKKTAADKLNVKHNPLDEFRAAAHRVRSGPTALGLPELSIKSAMCDAALETPGITKSSAQRLLWARGGLAPVWGVPMLKMDVVRSADINKTPDIRTRAFLPRWACEFELRYITPQFSMHSVATLLCNAGVLIGVGDYRQQKGKGSFGSFRVLFPDQPDEEWDDIVAEGRAIQEAALAEPDYADDETAELMEFYGAEKLRRAA